MSLLGGTRASSTIRLAGRFVLVPTVVAFVTLGSAPRATRIPEGHSFDVMPKLLFAAAFDTQGTFDDDRGVPFSRHSRGDGRRAPHHSNRHEFEVIDLGTLGGSFSQAWAINARGQVAGTSTTAGDAATHAFSWTATGGMIDLGTLGGSGSSLDFKYPLGVVNDSGQIVGSSSISGDAESHAFSWTATGGMIDLGTLGGIASSARAVNASGQVVGAAATADDELHAFSWTATHGMIDLGTLGGSFSSAVAVTDGGQVAGISTTADGETHAFSWTAAGGMIDLGTLGGSFSEARAVNASGQVVGDSTTADAETHAFSWTATHGVIDLGTLPGRTVVLPAAVNGSGRVVGQATSPALSVHAFSWTVSEGMVDLGTFGGNSSIAAAVNASGQVVGSADTIDTSRRHAFVWTTSGGLVDLGTALGGSFVDASAINDSGQIVGSSSEPGDATAHAVLWQPKQQKFTIVSVAADPSSLWPANHKMVPVSLSVSTSDDSASCWITGVSSNEGVNWPGQLNWAVTGRLTVNLRAERSGSGEGRVYTITVTCTNASNLSDTKGVTVNVPHDQRK
jgi:probable HAF family extracellular repeat protein